MMPLVKICSKKKTISRVLMSRRNRLTRENALKLKAVLAEKISQMRRIFYSVNYAVPWNEHVGIFSPQIALKPAFSQLYSFSFKFITSVSENYFWTKQRNKPWNWQEKKLRVQTRYDEGLTLETSAFLPFQVANLRFQLSC